MKWTIVIIIFILVLAGGTVAFVVYDFNLPIDVVDIKKGANITNFENCIKAGFPAMESYPRQCINEQGKIFVENIGNELEKDDLIRISNPRPNQIITSPLEIEGEARGFWFFEGDFPIRLLDENGDEISVVIAISQDEWMTEDFVTFKATIEFSKSATEKGTLVLEKSIQGDNDIPDSLIVPIIFKNFGKITGENCVATGCSGQVCANEEVVTTCEYHQHYSCYKSAVCKMQENSKCGWNMTDELVECLDDSSI